MRRIFYLFTLALILTPVWGQSTLSTGKWVKIEITQSGIYSISYAQLRRWGLNPESTHIYGYGGAMLSQDFSKPAIEDLPQVGCIRLSDQILFYGQGSFSWSYVSSHFQHTRNPYSDKGYYFLSDKPTDQPDLVTLAPLDSVGSTHLTSYMAYQVHEQDLVNLIDRAGEDGGGREWYGEQLPNNKTISVSLPFTNICGQTARIRVSAAGVSSSGGQIAVKLGTGTITLNTASISGNYVRAAAATQIGSLTPVGSESQTFKLTYTSSESNAFGFLNFIEMEVLCQLRMMGTSMPLRHPANYQSATPITYHLSGTDEGTLILDITDLSHIVEVPSTRSHDTLIFTLSQKEQVHELIAVNPAGKNWLTPTLVGSVDNQNLQALQGIQYVIISPKDFVPMAQQLAQAHANDYFQKGDPITTAVVTDEQVYNEFSSGTPDATAYRRLMKMLYDKAQADSSLLAPRWLLLMGDGTFDNRKLVSASGPNTLLTYQALNSTDETMAIANDGYFGYLESKAFSSEAGMDMLIGVGRLPVSTKQEAQAVVDKLVNYISDPHMANWHRDLLFLADNFDSYRHIDGADQPANILKSNVPGYILHKIYLDAYPKEVTSTSESCPLAKTQFDNLLQSGVLMLNYSGHGGYNAVTSEGMLNINGIRTMTNPNLALWFFATCSFAHFDSGKKCAAEEAVLNANGGAISVISPCRTVYADWNLELNKVFCEQLFAHSDDYHYDVTIGEALARAKNKMKGDSNKLAYNLLGDPALRLHYPDNLTVHTTQAPDTTRAMSVNHLSGVVSDATHDTLTSFNGSIEITVYDKQQDISTPALGWYGPYTYQDYTNILFHGTVQAKNGCFDYTFMTPKDIRYNIGTGRIVYYASDQTNLVEGVGYDHTMHIGGNSSVEITDNEGPDIHMYVEDSLRTDDQSTYSEPRFYATLFDSCGINTVGSGIGHDLILMVDNMTTMIYNLNAYYQADPGSYQRGKISYRLPALADGQHSLTLRAWDLMNNSSTQTLNFTVNAATAPTLYRVLVYPNPVSIDEPLTLHLEHDQQDEVLATEVAIYDLAGRKLYGSTQPDAYDVVIPINRMAITTGIYIYNIIIQSPTNGSATLSGKILVKGN